MAAQCPSQLFAARFRDGVEAKAWAVGREGDVEWRASWGWSTGAEPGLRFQTRRKAGGGWGLWVACPVAFRKDGYGRFRWRIGGGIQRSVRSARLLVFLKRGRLGEDQADHRTKRAGGSDGDEPRHVRYGGVVDAVPPDAHGRRHGAAGGRTKAAAAAARAKAKQAAAKAKPKPAGSFKAVAKLLAKKPGQSKPLRPKRGPRKTSGQVCDLPEAWALERAPVRRAPKPPPKRQRRRLECTNYRRCPVHKKWFPVSGPGRCPCCWGR